MVLCCKNFLDLKIFLRNWQKIINLNSRQAFFQHHFSDSCNLPFVELIGRVYELPPKGSSLILIGAEDVISQGREFFQQLLPRILKIFGLWKHQ